MLAGKYHGRDAAGAGDGGMNAGAITSAMIGDMEIETAKIRCTRVDVEKFRYACNFCGKGEEEVLQMVAGDRAVIGGRIKYHEYDHSHYTLALIGILISEGQ